MFFLLYNSMFWRDKMAETTRRQEKKDVIKEMIDLLNLLDEDKVIEKEHIPIVVKEFLKQNKMGDINIDYTDDSSCLGFVDTHNNSVIFSSIMKYEGNAFCDDLIQSNPRLINYRKYIYDYYWFRVVYYALWHVLRKQEYDEDQLDSIRRYLYEIGMRYSDDGIICLDNNRLPLELEMDVRAANMAYAMIVHTKMVKKELGKAKGLILPQPITYYSNDGKSPSELLAKSDDNIGLHELYRLVLNSGLPLNDLVNLGLPIPQGEYNRLIKKTNKF